MKSKTIKAVIAKKLESWFDSIEDTTVAKLARDNTIVTGGCIASMLLGEKVNDFDLYFRTREACKAIANYYVKRFKVEKRNGIPCKIFVDDDHSDRIKIVIQSSGIASSEGTDKPYEYFESRPEGAAREYVDSIIKDPSDIENAYEDTEKMALESDDPDNKYEPVFMSTNAITLRGKIQCILRFYGEPDEIHKNYDFMHCTNYYSSWNNQLILKKEALECLLSRELIYVGSKYPVCSIFRIRKFLKRDFTINAGQILKICMQISALDLTNIKVLQDQLTGVDCAYFLEVISKLKEKDPVKVNSAYLIEIIDRMF